MPTQPAASEMRPLSRADIATLKPSPSAPSIAESGTRTPSSESSAVSCARRPSLPFIGRASKPGRAGRDEERADPLRPLASRSREDDRRRRPRAERDEDLRASQHPLVAVAFGSGRQRSRVGAAARLGERIAAEPLAACQPGQQRLLLLVAPPLRHRLAEEPVRDRDDPAHRRVGAAELLAEQAVRDRVEPAAVELLRQPGGEEAGLGERRDSERGSSSASSQARACGTSSRSQSSRAEARISSCSGVSVKSMRKTWGPSPAPTILSFPRVRYPRGRPSTSWPNSVQRPLL